MNKFKAQVKFASMRTTTTRHQGLMMLMLALSTLAASATSTRELSARKLAPERTCDLSCFAASGFERFQCEK